ncbi:MAG: hypothetical protein R3C56_11770 [Pirellulaceae bacterium]
MYIPERKLLKTMLSETVRSITATLSPRELHKLWPPAASELKWIRLDLVKPANRQTLQHTRVLRTVAEPLSDGRNLTIVAGSREEVLGQMRTAISKGSCLIVGETGVGKTTLVSSVEREMFLARRALRKQQRDKGSDTGATATFVLVEQCGPLDRWHALPWTMATAARSGSSGAGQYRRSAGHREPTRLGIDRWS